MINIDAGRFLFQQRYHLYERTYITVEPRSPRSNELFFLTPVIVEYKAIRKQKHLDIS